MDKIILIENQVHALEYLKNKDKFLEFTPICFDFPSERLLSEKGIEVKTEEDYEDDFIYKGSYNLMIRNTEKICSKINIKYRGINLIGLFYADLSGFLGRVTRYERILKSIKNREKPREIIVFMKKWNLDPEYEICSIIARTLFQKVNIIEYDLKDKKGSGLNRIACFFQKALSRINLKWTNLEDNKIFFCGSKDLFEPIISSLQKNKKNKIFRCKDNLQASFFIDKKYVPFYQVERQKSDYQEILKKEIKSFKKNDLGLDFFKGVMVDSRLIPILKKWLDYYLDFKFITISEIINNLIKLMEGNKIDLILLYSDSPVFEKTFAQVSKKFNIPSIEIQHGIIGNKRGFCPLSVDYILTFGEESKKRLVSFGIPNSKIIITGSSQFDKYFDKNMLKYGVKLETKKNLEQELHRLDGKSTQRIINFINKLLLNKK